jgi:hypothetical protein
MSVLYVNLEQLYLKDMLAFVVYLKNYNVWSVMLNMNVS